MHNGAKAYYEVAFEFLCIALRFHEIFNRGVSGGWAGWEIAHPDFGRLEGFSRNKLDFIMAKIVNRLLTRMKSLINAMWQFYAL